MNRYTWILLASFSAVLIIGRGSDAGSSDTEPSDELLSQVAQIDTQASFSCVREVFNRSFCLGGRISDLEENRELPLIGKKEDGNFATYRYKENISGASVYTTAQIENGRIIKLTRTWEGPSNVMSTLQSKILGQYMQHFGRPDSSDYIRPGVVEERWHKEQYNISLIRGNETSVSFELIP